MMAKTIRPPHIRRDSDVAELRERLAQAEETLAAIRSGEVDALVVSGPKGDQVFTLQGAETPYRLLMEAMNEGALTVQPDGMILYCNSRFAEMVKTPVEQVIGASIYTFIKPDGKHFLQELLRELSPTGAKGEFSLLPAKPKGPIVPVQFSLRRLQVDEVNAVAVVATDLTERKRYEERLEHQNNELERRVTQRTADLTAANTALQIAQGKLRREAVNLEQEVSARTVDLQESVKSLEQFCYTIAHDLRAPLRAMQGFAHALLDEFNPQINDVARGYADRIINASARMDHLIRDLLAYGRLSSANLPIATIDLNEAVAGAVQSVRASESSNSAQIQIEGPLPRIRANWVVLGQTLENLISNAVKFVPANTIPEVRISAQQNGHWVRLSVWDNGIGIAPEFHQRVFGVFERLSPNEYPGTGIGLAIVQKGIERMGGRVGVESELGQGSCFWIELPKAK